MVHLDREVLDTALTTARRLPAHQTLTLRRRSGAPIEGEAETRRWPGWQPEERLLVVGDALSDYDVG